MLGGMEKKYFPQYPSNPVLIFFIILNLRKRYKIAQVKHLGFFQRIDIYYEEIFDIFCCYYFFVYCLPVTYDLC